MTILERINEKINYLKQNSQSELNRLTNILNIINSSQNALNDERIFKGYDFSIAINLVNSNSFGLIDLEKNINEIKNILIVKYDYHQAYLSLNEEYRRVIKSFNERLGYLKEEFERRIEEQSKVKIDEKTLSDLEDFKTLLEGKGRKKYYTYEMLEALFEVIDYNSLTYQDIDGFIKELNVSKNIKGKIIEDEKNIEDIYSLFEEYLGKRIKINNLKPYESEICTRINLDNARNILEFFKEKNIINNFNPFDVIRIAVYGRFDYVKYIYYEKVVPKDAKLKEMYFEEALVGVWINENSTKRRRNVVVKKKHDEKMERTLYSTISEITDSDVWENIRLIKENEDILNQKYDLSNLDSLWVISKPTWLIKKNIELFRLFNINSVSMTALVQSDLEDKMHFSVELGLLNSPRTYVFREIEKSTPRYNEFMLNGKKKKQFNTSILNYFSRNTSEIGKTSYTEYIYWFYKMQRSGKEEFYNNFFSSYQAGRRNKTDFYSKDDIDIFNNSSQMEKIIDDNFVTNYYDALIPNYDIYSEDLKSYYTSSQGDVIIPYFDEDILNDEKLERLEEHKAIDIYTRDGEIQKESNPYVYVFDKNIISRYKALRNLSILKHKYGYLNDDMILTAVVYNSYINKDTFELIKESIMKEGIVKWTI